MTENPIVLPASLSDWLTANVPGVRLDAMRRLDGGFRNELIHLTSTDGSHCVLRRYGQENRCAVEAALLQRVARQVPVPAVIDADPDGSDAGEPVLLSTFVPGVLLEEAILRLPPDDAAALGVAAAEVLVGIGDFGFDRPGFFTGRDLMPGPPGMEPTEALTVFVERCLNAPAARNAITPSERDQILELAAKSEPLLAGLRGSRRLVHGDFNGKNLLASRGPDGWRIAAVLDWEFAFSSSPLFDVGNVLRHRDGVPDIFLTAFTASYAAIAGALPADWHAIARALDLYALADFLTRPSVDAGVAALRDRIAGR